MTAAGANGPVQRGLESALTSTTSSPQILVVCTANHCRSPLVEFALGRRCHRLGLNWEVSSAGTRAEPGHPPHPYVQRLLASHGDTPSGWSSRHLTIELLDTSDLVLAASLEHRDQIIRLRPAAAHKTFTLLPFARFAAGLTNGLGNGSSGREALRATVAAARTRLPATETGYDLPDPIGRRYRFFRRLDRQVETAADAIVGRFEVTSECADGELGQRPDRRRPQ